MRIKELQQFCIDISQSKLEDDAILLTTYQEIYKKQTSTTLQDPLDNLHSLVSNVDFNNEVEALITSLCEKLSNNFSSLRSAFRSPNNNHITTQGNFTQRNELKKKLEKLASITISASQDKIDNIKRLFADAEFTVCIDGIIQYVEEKLGQLQINSFNTLVYTSLINVMNNIINKYLYKNKETLENAVPQLHISIAMERHNIASFRNIISEEWGIPSEIIDVYAIRDFQDICPEDILMEFKEYIKNFAESREFLNMLLQQIMSKILLPEFGMLPDENRNQFPVYVYRYLSTYDLQAFTKHLLIIGKNNACDRYKKNYIEILEHILKDKLYDLELLDENHYRKNDAALQFIEGEECDDGNETQGYHITHTCEDKFINRVGGIPVIQFNHMLMLYIEYDLSYYDEKDKRIITSEARVLDLLTNNSKMTLYEPTQAAIISQCSLDFFDRLPQHIRFSIEHTDVIKAVFERDDIEISRRVGLDRFDTNLLCLYFARYGKERMIECYTTMSVKDKISSLYEAVLVDNPFSAAAIIEQILKHQEDEGYQDLSTKELKPLCYNLVELSIKQSNDKLFDACLTLYEAKVINAERLFTMLTSKDSSKHTSFAFSIAKKLCKLN